MITYEQVRKGAEKKESWELRTVGLSVVLSYLVYVVCKANSHWSPIACLARRLLGLIPVNVPMKGSWRPEKRPTWPAGPPAVIG